MSSVPMLVWPANKVSCGTATAPGTLKGAPPRVGPTTRMSTVFDPVPPTTKPVMSPVPRYFKTDTFTSRGVVARKLAEGVASYSSAMTLPEPVAEMRTETMTTTAASSDVALA